MIRPYSSPGTGVDEIDALCDSKPEIVHGFFRQKASHFLLASCVRRQARSIQTALAGDTTEGSAPVSRSERAEQPSSCC